MSVEIIYAQKDSKVLVDKLSKKDTFLYEDELYMVTSVSSSSTPFISGVTSIKAILLAKATIMTFSSGTYVELCDIRIEVLRDECVHF